jgi:acyl-CoA synthetase (AMP-forming)/AMP-acid ligase II
MTRLWSPASSRRQHLEIASARRPVVTAISRARWRSLWICVTLLPLASGAAAQAPDSEPSGAKPLADQEPITPIPPPPAAEPRKLALGEHLFGDHRLITLGGAPVPTELVRRAREQGVKVAIGFGQTEASPYLTHTLPDDPHPDRISTVGRPVPETEIKIVSTETGAIVPVGEIGEICARGYSIISIHTRRHGSFDRRDSGSRLGQSARGICPDQAGA